MKIVVNHCYGGFGLSHEAIMLYAEKKGIKLYPYQQKDGLRGTFYRYKFDPELKNRMLSPHYLTVDHGDEIEYSKLNSAYSQGHLYHGDIERNDAALIATVEELAEKSNGGFASLAIVEIPDDVEWEIEDYDGMESVHEKHRSW